MATNEIIYNDRWGEIIAGDGYVEIRWFDTTQGMDGADFNAFLAQYATAVERAGQPGCLVDANLFRMDMDKMSMGWRDENIVPRYNAAGVKKFAFHMPAGMPAIGKPPTPEGPAQFPTAYFGTRTEALAWLAQ